MDTLKNLCEFKVKRSVPEDVMRVGLASWKFKLDLDEWLNNSPVPITLEYQLHHIHLTYSATPTFPNVGVRWKVE